MVGGANNKGKIKLSGANPSELALQSSPPSPHPSSHLEVSITLFIFSQSHVEGRCLNVITSSPTWQFMYRGRQMGRNKQQMGNKTLDWCHPV